MTYIFFSIFSKSKALPTNLSLHFGHAFLVIFSSHLLHVKCPLAQWRIITFFWNVSKQTGHSGMMVDQNFLLYSYSKVPGRSWRISLMFWLRATSSRDCPAPSLAAKLTLGHCKRTLARSRLLLFRANIRGASPFWSLMLTSQELVFTRTLAIPTSPFLMLHRRGVSPSASLPFQLIDFTELV